MVLLLPGENWNEIMGRDVMVKLHSRTEYAEEDPMGQTAQMGSSVTCNMKCFFMKKNPNEENEGEDELVRASDAPFETLTAQAFKIGEADAVPALELALRHSKTGDRLTLRATNRFAFGSVGRPAVISSSASSSPAIPPQTDLEFEIEVIKILGERAIDTDLLAKEKFIARPDSLTEDTDKKVLMHFLALSDIIQRKNAGNRWFSYGDFPRALRAYSKVGGGGMCMCVCVLCIGCCVLRCVVL
jgi:hypothetical protein